MCAGEIKVNSKLKRAHHLLITHRRVRNTRERSAMLIVSVNKFCSPYPPKAFLRTSECNVGHETLCLACVKALRAVEVNNPCYKEG